MTIELSLIDINNHNIFHKITEEIQQMTMNPPTAHKHE